MDNITLITLVFLIPIFFAIIFNTFFRQKKNANLKIVYYKIFLFSFKLLVILLVTFKGPKMFEFFAANLKHECESFVNNPLVSTQSSDL